MAARDDAPAVILAASPHWFLFPGRESVTLSAPQPGSASPAQPVQEREASLSTAIIQTGLFSSEDNAKAMAARLSSAGFAPRIVRRQVNSNEYWAVTVPGAADANKTIMELKNAGFEAFPVFD
jgi:cell division protein FtsN